MKITIRPTQQIKRINALIDALEEYSQYPKETLQKQPSEKAWSIVEVMKHMSIAQVAYREKINRTLAISSNAQPKSEFKGSNITSFLIKRFPPIEGEIKMKMKTSKQFKPIAINAEPHLIQQELMTNLNELKSWVEHYQQNGVSMKKFNSAIGAIVRFSVPEACEFILCHNERHFFQMHKTLKAISK